MIMGMKGSQLQNSNSEQHSETINENLAKFDG